MEEREREGGRLRGVISIGAVTYLNGDFTQPTDDEVQEEQPPEANWGQGGGMGYDRYACAGAKERAGRFPRLRDRKK